MHLTFDTGLNRELILSPSDYITTRVVRKPQPECVRTYRIHAGNQLVTDVQDNHQRKRVHYLHSPITTTTLKIEILATNGIPDAHLFEIRAY